MEKNQILSKQNGLIEHNKVLLSMVKNKDFKVNRRLEHFGFIKDLASLKECVEAMSFLNQKNSTSNEALEELGLSKEYENLFLGYPINDWKYDIKKRKYQIEALLKIEANKKAIELLEKHLSPEDIFNRDMEKMEDILNENKDLFDKTVYEEDI